MSNRFLSNKCISEKGKDKIEGVRRCHVGGKDYHQYAQQLTEMLFGALGAKVI